jgi:glycosyltransferase involved in cell wall biosynthesis
MKKISIAMYSTLEGDSFKGAILAPIIKSIEEKDSLGNVYGLIDIKSKRFNTQKNFHVTRIPIIASSIMKKISHVFKLPSYYAYRFGETITGLVFFPRILVDPSLTIILKPRPNIFVKLSALKKKKIVIDSGEMHPRYYQKACLKEYEKFGIHQKSIFADERSVRQIEKSLQAADIVITLTEASKQSYLDYGVPSNKIVCFNLGVSADYKKKLRQFDSTKKIAFFITAHHSILKGTHRVINAWKKIKDTKNSELIIIGSLHNDLKEFLSKIECPDNIKFTGPLKSHDILELYNNYNSVGIMNSFSEGYCRAVVEYLQNGMPVVVSKVSTCDVIIHEHHGFIVEPEDEKAIQEYLEFFINNSQVYGKFCENINKLSLRSTLDYANDISELLVSDN